MLGGTFSFAGMLTDLVLPAYCWLLVCMCHLGARLCAQLVRDMTTTPSSHWLSPLGLNNFLCSGRGSINLTKQKGESLLIHLFILFLN
ncbi:hypothetical protein BCU12_18675 [Vibrio sp. 10N.261.55.A7]|nr:hypothetical protein BCU12_18675 [Vibrio sp. 10N.261.55.A7]